MRQALAMGLLNTQIDVEVENDLARRDGLLDELRRWPASSPMTPRWAK